MILLIAWIGTVRRANTAYFLHDRQISMRTIAEKSPVFASASVDYVIDRRRAQNFSTLNVSMFHTRSDNLLPRPCGARRKTLYPIPLPKTSRDFGILKVCATATAAGLGGHATFDVRRARTTSRLSTYACRHVACRSRKSHVVCRTSKSANPTQRQRARCPLSQCPALSDSPIYFASAGAKITSAPPSGATVSVTLLSRVTVRVVMDRSRASCAALGPSV